MRPIVAFVRRLLVEQPLRFCVVVGALFAAGILEGLGIAAVIPLLQLASGEVGSEGRTARALEALLGVFHLPLTVATSLIVVGVMLVGQQLVLLLQQKIASGSQYRFEAGLREHLYSDIFAARWPFFIRHKTGELTNALTVEPGRAGYAYQGVAFILGSMFIIVVYGTLALLISWQMTAIVLACGFTVIYLLRSRMTRAADIGITITDTNAELQSSATEHISGAKLIKGCAGEGSSIRLFSRYAHQLAGQLYASSMNQMTSKVTFDSVSLVVMLVIMYLAISVFRIPIANLIVFLFVFYRLSPRLSQLQATLQTVRSFLPALAAIDALALEAREMREREGGRVVRGFEEAVSLRGVDFSHVPGYPTLSSVSLSVPKGKTIAVVGPSGSGKTTVVDLIMGLLVPDAGQVVVDSVPLSEIDLHEWRSGIGYVAQDSTLFHASVRENIVWSVPDATPAEIEEAARLANASRFIARLPEGYDTIVGDRGVTLSGGQRQRLALARAILGKPHLLILDEATSALDAEAEEKVRDAVDRLSGRTTVLIVTHRLASVRGADLIYVIEDGKVVETGSWDELTNSRGRFEQLRALQALG